MAKNKGSAKGKLDTAAVSVEVDFPKWMIDAVDAHAKRIGIARQDVIKLLIDDALAVRASRIKEAASTR